MKSKVKYACPGCGRSTFFSLTAISFTGQLIETAEIECGSCGDCLHCYGGDSCYPDGSEHFWFSEGPGKAHEWKWHDGRDGT